MGGLDRTLEVTLRLGRHVVETVAAVALDHLVLRVKQTSVNLLLSRFLHHALVPILAGPIPPVAPLKQPLDPSLDPPNDPPLDSWLNPALDLHLNPALDLHLNPALDVHLNPTLGLFLNPVLDLFLNPAQVLSLDPPLVPVLHVQLTGMSH